MTTFPTFKTTGSKIRIGVALAILAVANPWMIEGTSNNCAALERTAMRLADVRSPLTVGFMGMSNGRLAEAMALTKVPNVPAPLTCAAGYWIGAWSKP